MNFTIELSKHKHQDLDLKLFNSLQDFFLEFTSVLSISFLTIYFLYLDYKMTEILVNLGLITIALFRILPSTNRIVKNVNDIRFGMNSVRIIEKEYKLLKSLKKIKKKR